MERVPCDPAGAAAAARVIGRGGVVVYPTDTVYGLGCDPYDAEAVRRVFRIKGRDWAKPFPVLARSSEAASRVADLGPAAERLASVFWPGRLTMVLRLRDASLREPMGLGRTVAVRVPGGACVQAILAECDLIVGTSANASGSPPTRDPSDLLELGCDLLVDGGLSPGTESTIVDVSAGTVRYLREGAVAREDVESAL